MAVQLYVQAYLGHYHILTYSLEPRPQFYDAFSSPGPGLKANLDQEGIQPKTDDTAEIYAPIYLFMHNLSF